MFPSDEFRTSCSKIGTYLRCPMQYAFRYVTAEVPSHRSAALAFGSAMGAALAFYHIALKEERKKPPLSAVLEEFDMLFAKEQIRSIPILWPESDSPETMAAQAHHLLTLYYETVKLGPILGVEVPFRINSSDLPASFSFPDILGGIVDLIEEGEDGRPVIVELKTAARRFDTSRLKYDPQITTYTVARAALGYPDADIKFRVLLKTKQVAIEEYPLRRDKATIDEFGKVASGVLKAIDNRIFYPVRGWMCSSCEFRHACPGDG